MTQQSQMIKQVVATRILFYLIIGSVLLSVGACSNTKYLPAGESLYVGSRIALDGPKLSGKKKKNLKVLK